MDGVAHTIEVEKGHKKISFSASYFDHIYTTSPEQSKDWLLRKEIMGVTIHELVHVFQFNGKNGNADAGLIEGIADYVRLKAKLSPAHWSPSPAQKWNQGYDKTAYFLEWIETHTTPNFVERLNLTLKDTAWNENLVKQITGISVDDLWNKYIKTLA